MTVIASRKMTLSVAARLAILAGAILYIGSACGGGGTASTVVRTVGSLADEAARFAAAAADDAARAAVVASADESARILATTADDAARTAARYAEEAARAATAGDEAAALSAKASAELAARSAATAADEAVNIAALLAKADLDNFMSNRWATLTGEIEAYLGRQLTQEELSGLAASLKDATCNTLEISDTMNEQMPSTQLPISLIFVPDINNNLLEIAHDVNGRFWSNIEKYELEWAPNIAMLGCEISDLP